MRSTLAAGISLAAQALPVPPVVHVALSNCHRTCRSACAAQPCEPCTPFSLRVARASCRLPVLASCLSQAHRLRSASASTREAKERARRWQMERMLSTDLSPARAACVAVGGSLRGHELARLGSPSAARCVMRAARAFISPTAFEQAQGGALRAIWERVEAGSGSLGAASSESAAGSGRLRACG